MEVDIMEGRELNTIIARAIGYSDTHNFVGDVVEAVRLWDVMSSQGWRVSIRDAGWGEENALVWLEKPSGTVLGVGPTWLVALGRAVVKAESI